jgi:CRP-like cAMP-binding protein
MLTIYRCFRSEQSCHRTPICFRLLATLNNLHVSLPRTSHESLIEEEIEKILSETPLLSTLDREKIGRIARLSEKRSFQPNEFIIHEGDIGSGFFLILEGQVEARQGSHPIRRMGRGQFFGEAALIKDEPRSADVVAIEPTMCLKLGASQIGELLGTDPQITTKLLNEMIKRNRATTRVSITEDKNSSSGKLFDFESDLGQRIFDSLADSFINDYMVKKLVAEKCGWRTITEISRETGISLSALYGRQGGFGVALDEPVRRGLVETRFFPGERGRGGEIMRFRIAYEKEPINSYVNQRIRTGRRG